MKACFFLIFSLTCVTTWAAPPNINCKLLGESLTTGRYDFYDMPDDGLLSVIGNSKVFLEESQGLWFAQSNSKEQVVAKFDVQSDYYTFSQTPKVIKKAYSGYIEKELEFPLNLKAYVNSQQEDRCQLMFKWTDQEGGQTEFYEAIGVSYTQDREHYETIWMGATNEIGGETFFYLERAQN